MFGKTQCDHKNRTVDDDSTVLFRMVTVSLLPTPDGGIAVVATLFRIAVPQIVCRRCRRAQRVTI